MAVPLARPQPHDNESSTRLKQAAEHEPDGRHALVPAPPGREMKIPRGMPVLPGGRRMPPLPVRLRESFEPLRRSLAPLRRSLAPLFAQAPEAHPRKRRWPLAFAALLMLVSAAAYLVHRVR